MKPEETIQNEEEQDNMDQCFKCPICKHDTFSEENGCYYVCQKCGHRVPILPSSNIKPKLVPVGNKSQKSSEKPPKPLPDRLIRSGLIAFGMGVVLLLGIIIVGLAVYGRVYFFDGYDITKILTIVSIVELVGGPIELLVGFIMKFSQK